MSERRWLACIGLIGLLAGLPAHADHAFSNGARLPADSSDPVPECRSLVECERSLDLPRATADEVAPQLFDETPKTACCVSVAGPDPQAGDGYFALPTIFSPITETDPVVVTAELGIQDASHRSHLLGAHPAVSQELTEEADAVIARSSSPPQTITAVVVSAGLCALGWMRYRVYRQRQIWRRSAAKRRARRR